MDEIQRISRRRAMRSLDRLDDEASWFARELAHYRMILKSLIEQAAKLRELDLDIAPRVDENYPEAFENFVMPNVNALDHFAQQVENNLVGETPLAVRQYLQMLLGSPEPDDSPGPDERAG